jgi:hypothetical protein
VESLAASARRPDRAPGRLIAAPPAEGRPRH